MTDEHRLRLIYSMAERIYAQSELLSRRAEKPMSRQPAPASGSNPHPAMPQRKTPSGDFADGFSAFLAGKSTADCPFFKGSDEALSWQRGYDEAEYVTRC